jgi:hypothetical protein
MVLRFHMGQCEAEQLQWFDRRFSGSCHLIVLRGPGIELRRRRRRWIVRWRRGWWRRRRLVMLIADEAKEQLRWLTASFSPGE